MYNIILYGRFTEDITGQNGKKQRRLKKYK
jgi:hypothetical protein